MSRLASRAAKKRTSWLARVVLVAFLLTGLLVLLSFYAARSGEGGLHGVYRPAQGKALSEDELADIDRRLGVGFIGTEFAMWVKESAVGNFGWKPPTFMALTAVLGAAWLVARRNGGR